VSISSATVELFNKRTAQQHLQTGPFATRVGALPVLPLWLTVLISASLPAQRTWSRCTHHFIQRKSSHIRQWRKDGAQFNNGL